MRKYIYKAILLYLLGLGLIIFLYRMINKCDQNITDHNKEKKILVGKYVIIQKDTILITRYNWMHDSYILYNRKELSTDVINNLTIINKK